MHKSYESLPVFAYPIRVRKFVDYHSVDHIHWHEEIELGRLRGLMTDTVCLPDRI